jgi:hypothetical protein
VSEVAETDNEEMLVTGDELWWRQCPAGPTYFDEVKGRPTSLMFRWNDEDAGQLSGARETKTTAEQAYKHATDVEKRASKGTWGIPAFTAAAVGCKLVDDSITLPPPPASPPGHTYLDVGHVPTGNKRPDKDERERIRSKLLLAAKQHWPAAAPSSAAASSAT